jgi:hypothetical protein
VQQHSTSWQKIWLATGQNLAYGSTLWLLGTLQHLLQTRCFRTRCMRRRFWRAHHWGVWLNQRKLQVCSIASPSHGTTCAGAGLQWPSAPHTHAHTHAPAHSPIPRGRYRMHMAVCNPQLIDACASFIVILCSFICSPIWRHEFYHRNPTPAHVQDLLVATM